MYLPRRRRVAFLIEYRREGVPSGDDVWVVSDDFGEERDGLCGIALDVGHICPAEKLTDFI